MFPLNLNLNINIDDPGHERAQPRRIVADLGNSRLKWGRLDEQGQLVEAIALPLDDPSEWERVWRDWDLSSEEKRHSTWHVASVNPPLARRFAEFLELIPVSFSRWFHSAKDVPMVHSLENAETAGADRALAVLGAKALKPRNSAGLVVLCGTAITVERIGNDGTWLGGAIAPGLTLSAKAMHLLTAQLPLIEPVADPPSWGRSTIPALRAGVYWGVVGAVRELLSRQSIGLDAEAWIVFSGGDATALHDSIDLERSEVVPDLVLRGLALVGSSQ